MESEVELQGAAPRRLAAAWGTTSSNGPYGTLVIDLLNQVWPVLRGQNVTTGQNVVVYFNGSPLRIAGGVEVPDGFEPTETVQPVDTPSGETATVAHWGEYSQLRSAYLALERWCTANNRKPAGINWEVYGDWHEDPAQLRTDVFMLLESP